jgi:hypothetical protein
MISGNQLILIKPRVFPTSNRYNSRIMNARQFFYVPYQTTRATCLALEKNSALVLAFGFMMFRGTRRRIPDYI